MASCRDLRIVSFDGGDVRSFSQLEIMRTIMHQLNWNEAKPPCERFNFMGGSGTGGLIAIMFARLRMSIDEVFDEFASIVEQVYQADLLPLERTKRLRACLEDLMRRRNHPLDMKFIEESSPKACACFVISRRRASSGTKVCVRSYHIKSLPASPITIIDAALATCVTQPRFAPAVCGQGVKKKEYIGAGVGAGNPIREVIAEAQSLFGGDALVSSLLSLGNGHPGIITLPSGDVELGLAKAVQDMMNDCTQTAREIEQQIENADVYYRFSVEQGMQNEHSCQIVDPSWILAQTESYIEDPATSKKLSTFVQNIDDTTQSVTIAQLKSGYISNLSLQLPPDWNKPRLHVVVTNSDDEILRILKPGNLEYGSHITECMEGTRQDILAAISSWADDLNAPNILWLKGYPGVGKSAVASSVVERLRPLMRLGSSFFFRRDNANDMTPNALWRVVAYDLARQYPPIKEKIVAALKVDETIPTTVNVDKLFCQLILNPIIASENMLKGALPVIVIDALDECGGLDGQYSEHRKSLLQTLKNWSRLSSSFKLFVTSRDENDINQCFSTTDHQLVEISAGISVKAQTSEDIATFQKYRFQKIARKYPRSLSLDWPGHQVVQELTTMAQGLFIWVIVITNLADRGDPEERLSQILRGGGASGMTRLYSLLLNISFPDQSGDFTTCFRSILGAVILAKVPLAILSLTQLLSVKATAMEHICNGLQAVMDSQNTLRIHHQSFVDFLIDRNECPPKFFIDLQRESRTLTIACLKTMRDHLRFNICNLETSYFRNEDIQDLATRIEACVSPQLSYSSCFWASHLANTPVDLEIIGYLERFMDKQFLYWLEVLSLIKRVNIALGMLWILIDYLQAGDQTETMARDMQKFVATFGRMISQSLPHIYLSALPFAPRNSVVSRKYVKLYPQTLAVMKGGQSDWPIIQNVLVGHEGPVDTVSFSPDGSLIVSGSFDKTIRVWDAETGEVIAGPFKGHYEKVLSAKFSPNGERVASGASDKTVRVWDAETGEMVAGPLKGHNGSVNSVAFSPDGRRIASGSSDTTIRVWDTGSGELIVGPLKRHGKAVNCVTFSPDGRQIASGSDDTTIRLWDAETGKVVMWPLQGHSTSVTSVHFLPKGRRIVSGSTDKTLRVWDAETGKVAIGPLEGHDGPINSLAISLDGRRIISSSKDGIIQVWDAETGKMVAGPLKEHDHFGNSFGFSPDGRRVVSGSLNGKIRVWDVKTSQMIAAPLNRTYSQINSIEFSPDGRRIVSGCYNGTIMIYDTETGEMIAGPFKGHDKGVNSIAFSPDGRLVVSGSADYTVRVWDAKTGEIVRSPLKGHNGSVNSVTFSPDGRMIASGATDRAMRIWDAESGEPVRVRVVHRKAVRSVTFSHDGTRIASGSSDGTIYVWDAQTGQMVVGPLEGYNGDRNLIAFSPDGGRIIAGYYSYYNKAIGVWDAETGKLVAGPPREYEKLVRSMGVSSDGRWIVCGKSDGSISVHDVETGEVILGPLKGHDSSLSSVTFSPDGRQVASDSDDGTVRVWDITMGESIRSTASHFNNTSEIKDGWVLGPNSESLFWVPHELRKGLCRPRNTSSVGPFLTTKLDLSAFVHGESWVQCKDDRMACDSGMV